MFKPSNISFFILCVCLPMNVSLYAQEDEAPIKCKNQISSNIALPIFGSVDLNYERTIANKWAIGVGVAIYGDRFQELNISTYGDYNYANTYEITPFARFYFQGAQRKSHFVEVFGSISEVEESGRYIRTINTEGYGVYDIGTKVNSIGGLGMGYGYRFLFLNDKLVLEAQIGIRTNFEMDYLFLNGALVRTGIKLGYRF